MRRDSLPCGFGDGDAIVEALPAARSATLTTNLHSLGWGSGPIAIQGRTYATDRDYPSAYQTSIAPRFFETFGITVLKGRDFTPSDDASAQRVAVVNRSFAESFFKGEERSGGSFAKDEAIRRTRG